MKLFWMILAASCIVAAAFFLLRSDLDSAFLLASIGMVAWFLNYRIRLKEIMAAADIQRGDEKHVEDMDESDDE